MNQATRMDPCHCSSCKEKALRADIVLGLFMGFALAGVAVTLWTAYTLVWAMTQ